MKSFAEFNSKPYVIAELSSNHCKNIEITIKSIEAAARTGADAIKTQLYTPDSLTIPNRSFSPVIEEEGSPWFGQKLYDLYDEASLPYEWYPRMLKCAKDNSIDLFASVFDEESLNYALELNLPLIKISSFELIHLPLLKAVQKTGLPAIVSTGMAEFSEIEKCIQIFKGDRNKICLLKCTSDYPASIKTTHIGQMSSMGEMFKVPVGLSDHSLSNLPSVIATSLGAIIIEKHFILDKKLKTPDSFFSLDESDFKNLVMDIRSTTKMLELKDLEKIRQKSESHSVWERPSLYFSRDLCNGHRLKIEDFIVRRPSLGLNPSELDFLIGKQLNRVVKKYEPTKVDFFNN